MIENRDSFLQTIATQLGRPTVNLEKPSRSWKHSPQHAILKDATKDELVELLVEQCANIHTTVNKCSKDNLPTALKTILENLQATSIIYNKDSRFNDLLVTSAFAHLNASEWDAARLEENIQLAEKADVSIVFSEITLAESATIVVQASPETGRALSFLPTNSIAIIPKSSIVPRMTQAAQYLRGLSRVSSCVNFITGPSNSADIEMNLVVGVHGPIRMIYLIVEDL